MPGISAVSPPISAQPACSQPRGDAFHHCGGHRYVQLAAGEVVEEEQRLGTLHENVVDAHGYQVDAYGVVAAEFEGELELGAHAVGAGYQHRVAVPLGYLEQRAEATDTRQHAFAQRAPASGLMFSHQRIAGVDVYAGRSVVEADGSGLFAHV